MKLRASFLLLLSLAAARAEESAPQGRDLVPSGLRPLVIREPKKSNEVTVVLEPTPAGEMIPAEEPPVPEPPLLIDTVEDPQPAEAEMETPPAPAPESDAGDTVSPEPEISVTPPPPASKEAGEKKGVIVQVEKLLTPSGPVDPADVKLLAPFLAKPASTTPKGWKLETVSSAPPFAREVEIAPGSKITLNIRPHVLVPEADGSTTFPVTEPGYDSALGYHQTATVGAILSESLHRMEDDSKRMGDAIDRLEQLLVSLPKPPEPEISVENAPVAKPVRK